MQDIVTQETGSALPPPHVGGSLFAGLDGDDLAAVRMLGRPRRFDPGEAIFSLGASADTIYVVRAGRVALTLPLPLDGGYREISVQEMGPGAVIGWSALVAPNKYTFGARAVDRTALVAYAAADLESLFDAYPQIRRGVTTNLTGVIAGRLTQVQAMLIRGLQRRLASGGTT